MLLEGVLKMNKTEKAVQCFNSGLNCSQAIFSVYGEQFGINTELALKISSGFGGGMGRLCETCGAVTGAFMVIGLKYGNITFDDKDGKEKTYAMIQEFAKRFKERNQSTKCEDLLGTHIVSGDKGKAALRVKEVCPKMVLDAAEILDELL
jgi:C_GCAxxG_C_C family probable redox protein